MIPRDATVYVGGYHNGVRLRHVEQPLIKNLAIMDGDLKDFLWGPAFGSYVLGFSDGWHDIAPLVPLNAASWTNAASRTLVPQLRETSLVKPIR